MSLDQLRDPSAGFFTPDRGLTVKASLCRALCNQPARCHWGGGMRCATGELTAMALPTTLPPQATLHLEDLPCLC